MKKLLILLWALLFIISPNTLVAQEAYAVVKEGTVSFYYDNNKTSHEGTMYDVTKELKMGYPAPAWANSNLKVAVFDASFSKYSPPTARFWFNGCSNLTEIRNISNLNLAEVTDISNMFCGCSSLQKLDLSGLNTTKVKSMQSLFWQCTNLTELILQGVDTNNVEDMSFMFSDCGKLEQLDLSSFNSFNVTNMYKMFMNCVNLRTIYASDGWNTDKVNSSSNMFWLCSNLVGGEGTKCDGWGFGSAPIDHTYARIDKKSENSPGYFTYKSSPVGINSFSTDKNDRTSYYYSLDGKRVVLPQKGINVINGKKIIVK